MACSSPEGRGADEEELRARVQALDSHPARHVPEVPSGPRRSVGVQPSLLQEGHLDHRRVAVGRNRPPERAALPAE